MMAKDNREIVHGIRVLVEKNTKNAQSVTFKSGMEDELAAAFTQKQLDAMKQRGDITGNWKSIKK
jgi:hypothetical protein